MTQDQISKLHDFLVKSVIDFANKNNITELDEIDFSIDTLNPSIEMNGWHPSTDSSLYCWKYDKISNEKNF